MKHAALLLFCLLGLAPSALAGTLTVHVGPPAVGSGGPNPVSIPPINPVEYEVEWITPSGFESNIAITPGLLFGVRTQTGGVYVGFGGGLVLSSNGGGPGIYSSLGWNHGLFNAEIKQAIGWDYSHNQMVSPYAIRVGMNFDF